MNLNQQIDGFFVQKGLIDPESKNKILAESEATSISFYTSLLKNQVVATLIIESVNLTVGASINCDASIVTFTFFFSSDNSFEIADIASALLRLLSI